MLDLRCPTIIAACALACAASALGFACGSTLSPTSAGLPQAGSPEDDGSGLLAGISGAESTLGRAGGNTYGNYSDFSHNYADLRFGGAGYGNATYGGTLYGSYEFNWGTSFRRGMRPVPSKHYESDYRSRNFVKAGAIIGRVTWPRPPRRAATRAGQPCTAEQGAVADVDARGNVRGAVVYLQDITRGRFGLTRSSFRILDVQTGGVLTHRDCQFSPLVQVVAPIGAALSLTNAHDQAREWVGTLGDEPSFRVQLGANATRDIAMTRAGIIRIRDPERGSTAWVVVAGHPYYAITDDQGRFRLDEIPPGKYRLVVWHPPIARRASNGRVALSRPFERAQTIAITAGKTRSVTLRLPSAR